MSEKLIKAMDKVRSLPQITLGKIVDEMGSESLVVVCLISILPFMQPIPLPGISSLLGFVVLLQGLGLMIWGKPLLTQRMKAYRIQTERFEKIYHLANKFSGFTSRISTVKHPIATTRVVQLLSGLAIVLLASFLSLPLPIPLSNFIPALGIFSICVGLLEEDLLLILIGYGITLTIVRMGLFSYQMLLDHFSWGI
jgi:hypothetical protein